jgi:ribosome-associated toxin RatA of RatAB toxin-antitoxin module
MERILEIVKVHGITYEPLKEDQEGIIATRLSRVYPASQERLYEMIADLEDHSRLFSHCKSALVVDKTGLEKVIDENQFIVVSDVAEGGSRLAISRYTLQRPHRIDEDLMTDPWPATGVEDRKDGRISWIFEAEGDDRCRMTCESEFEIDTGVVFVRGLIDHVWLDFFENVMVELGELSRSEKLTLPPEEGAK